MYVCVRMCVRVYVCAFDCAYVCIRMSVCAGICECVYERICVGSVIVYACVCKYVGHCVFVCINVRM